MVLSMREKSLSCLKEPTVMKRPERSGAWRRNSPAFQLLEKVISLVSPLNLTDPGSAAFTPDNCVTLHDLARFVHEKSYREMFMMGDNVGDLRGAGLQAGCLSAHRSLHYRPWRRNQGNTEESEAEAFSDCFRAPFRALDRNVAREDPSVRPAAHGPEWFAFYHDAPCHDEPRGRKHFS